MTLARYLVIQAMKSGKVLSRSALRPLDIAGLSQLLVQVSNLVVDCPEIQRLDIHPLLASANEFTLLDVTLQLAPLPVITKRVWLSVLTRIILKNRCS
jgi:hypothetical protein